MPGDSIDAALGAPGIEALSVGEIIDRLEKALNLGADRSISGGALLAFDGDGTLWEGDIGVEVFEALLRRGPSGIREPARDELAAEARRYGIEIGGSKGVDVASAHAIAVALHEAFLDGRYPDRNAYSMNAWVFAGWTESEMDTFADEALSEGRIDERHRDGVRPLLVWARERGVDAYVVSASPWAAVRRAALGLGFSVDRILAMTPAVLRGELLPRIAGSITYGDGKLVAIRDARPSALLLGAFGDSAWDAAMLRASSVPVAVHPGPGLIAIAGSIPGLIAMEV